MKRAVLIQSPAHLFDVVPIFYREASRHNLAEKFYIVTNYPNPEEKKFGSDCQIIRLEKDWQTSGNFLRALEYVEEDIVLIMCEDHIIKKTQGLNQAWNIITKNPEIGRLQLSKQSSQTPLHSYFPNIKKVDPGYRYYINLQPSLWRKKFFKICLVDGENAWEFELKGTKRARNSEFISCVFTKEAILYENFYASCKIWETNLFYDMKNDKPYYREEYVRYALHNNIPLDPKQKVLFRKESKKNHRAEKVPAYISKIAMPEEPELAKKVTYTLTSQNKKYKINPVRKIIVFFISLGKRFLKRYKKRN